jgi:hypothetical protein
LPISAVDTIALAFQHTKKQLFQPFHFWQWTRLAFVGLLAGEMSSGGSRFNFPMSFPQGSSHSHPQFPGGTLPDITWPHINLALLGAFIAILAIVGIVFVIVMAYISSVMRFILFDSVLTKQCRIRESWRRRQGAGWRLFLWQLLVMLVTFGGFVVLIGIPLGIAYAAGWLTSPGDHVAALVLSGIALFFVFVAFVILAALVHVLTKDFVVPQMALEGIGALEGWRRLWAMMGAERGGYAVYVLMKILLAMGAAIVLGIVTFIFALFIVIPVILVAVLAAVGGKSAGLSWDAYTITLAIVVACALFAAFLYLVALISVPAIVFFPAYAMYFFAPRYRELSLALYGPPPAPPMMPAPQPIG